MILIDITCPAGALDEADRTAFANEVISGLVGSAAETASPYRRKPCAAPDR